MSKKFNINPKIIILESIKYIAVFILIYGAVNFLRQPIMPSSPILTITDINEQTHDMLALSKEKPILIYFWATWCHICKHTTPNVLEIGHHTPVFAIAVNSGNHQHITQHLNHHSKSPYFFVVNDEMGTYFNDWQGQVTPSYVIIKNGQAVQSFVGIQPTILLKARLAWANFQ